MCVRGMYFTKSDHVYVCWRYVFCLSLHDFFPIGAWNCFYIVVFLFSFLLTVAILDGGHGYQTYF